MNNFFGIANAMLTRLKIQSCQRCHERLDLAQNLKNEVFLDTSQFLNLNLINYEKHEIHIGRYGGSLTLGSWM